VRSGLGETGPRREGWFVIDGLKIISFRLQRNECSVKLRLRTFATGKSNTILIADHLPSAPLLSEGEYRHEQRNQKHDGRAPIFGHRPTVPTKNPKLRDKGGSISVGSSIERSGGSAEWYIGRGVGALPREANGSSAALDYVLAPHRMRARCVATCYGA
jgi:hypothetical protein